MTTMMILVLTIMMTSSEDDKDDINDENNDIDCRFDEGGSLRSLLHPFVHLGAAIDRRCETSSSSLVESRRRETVWQQSAISPRLVFGITKAFKRRGALSHRPLSWLVKTRIDAS